MPSNGPQQWDEDAWLEALSGQESGDDYSIKRTDRTGATGRWQVIESNVKAWTKEVLGVELSPEEFAADPSAQDVVVRAKVRQYQSKRGDNLAELAKDWYGRGKPPAGHPSPDQYAKSVIGRYQKALAKRQQQGQGGQAQPQAQNTPDLAELQAIVDAQLNEAAPATTPAPLPTSKGTEGQVSPDGKFKWSNGRWIDNTNQLPSQLNPAGVDRQQLVVDPNNPQQGPRPTGPDEPFDHRTYVPDPNAPTDPAGTPLPLIGDQYQPPQMTASRELDSIQGGTSRMTDNEIPEVAAEYSKNQDYIYANIPNQDQAMAIKAKVEAGMQLDDFETKMLTEAAAKGQGLVDSAGRAQQQGPEDSGQIAIDSLVSMAPVVNADGTYNEAADSEALWRYKQYADKEAKKHWEEGRALREWGAERQFGVQFDGEGDKSNFTLAQANNRLREFVFGAHDPGEGEYHHQKAIEKGLTTGVFMVNPETGKKIETEEEWQQLRDSRALSGGKGNPQRTLYIPISERLVALRKEYKGQGKKVFDPTTGQWTAAPSDDTYAEALTELDQNPEEYAKNPEWAGRRKQTLNWHRIEKDLTTGAGFNGKDTLTRAKIALANKSPEERARIARGEEVGLLGKAYDAWSGSDPLGMLYDKYFSFDELPVANEREWLVREAYRMQGETTLLNNVAEAYGLQQTASDYQNPGMFLKPAGKARPVTPLGVGMMYLLAPSGLDSLVKAYYGADKSIDYDRVSREAYQQFAGVVAPLTDQWVQNYDPTQDRAYNQMTPEQRERFNDWRSKMLMPASTIGATGNILINVLATRGAGSVIKGLSTASRIGKFKRFVTASSQLLSKGEGVGLSAVEALVYSASTNARKMAKPTMDEWVQGGGWSEYQTPGENAIRYVKDVIGDLPDNFLQFQFGRYFEMVGGRIAKQYGLTGLRAAALGRGMESLGEMTPEMAKQLAMQKLNTQDLMVNGVAGLLMGTKADGGKHFIKSSQSGKLYSVSLDGEWKLANDSEVGKLDVVLPSAAIFGPEVDIDGTVARLTGTGPVKATVAPTSRYQRGPAVGLEGQAAEDQAVVDAGAATVTALAGEEGTGPKPIQTIFTGDDQLRFAAERSGNIEEELTKAGPARLVGQAELAARALNDVADEIETGILGRKEVKPTNSVLGLNDTEAQPAVKPAKGKKEVAAVIQAAIDKAATAPDGSLDSHLKVKLTKEVGSILSEDMGPKELAKAVRTLAQKAATEAESLKAEYAKPENQKKRYDRELTDATQELERLSAERDAAAEARKPHVEAYDLSRQDLEASQADLEAVETRVRNDEAQAQKALEAAKKEHEQTYHEELPVDIKERLNLAVKNAEANLAQVKEQGKVDLDHAKSMVKAAKNANTEAMKAVNESGKIYSTLDKAYNKALRRQDNAYANREGFIKEQKQAEQQKAKEAATKEATSPAGETKPKSEQKTPVASPEAKATPRAETKEAAAPKDVETKEGRMRILSDPKQVKSLIKQAQDTIKTVTEDSRVKADNKGASIALDGTTPTKGYAVAIDQQFEYVVPEGMDEAKAIEDYLARVDVRKELAKRTNTVIGMWRNPELGNRLTLDISEIHQDRGIAERKGEARSQWGYHDIAKGLRLDPEGNFESGYTPLSARQAEEALYKHLSAQMDAAGNKYVPENMRIASRVYSFMFAGLAKRDGLAVEDVIKMHWHDGLLGIKGINRIATVAPDGKSLILSDEMVDEDGNLTLFMRDLPPEALSLLASNVVQDDVNSEAPALIREVVPKLNALVANKVHLPKGRELSKPEVAAKYTKESTEQFVENTFESVMDFFNHYLPQDNGEFVARAFHWYGPGVEEAMKEMAKFYPELALDKDGKPVDYYAHTMVGTMLGITSAGVSPDQALDATVPMYEDYRAAREQAVKDGKDPDLVPIPLVDVTKFVNTNSNYRDGDINWTIELALPGGGYGMASYTGAVTINGIAAKKFGGSMSKTLDWLYSRHPVQEIVAASNLTKSTSLDLPDESNPYGAYVLGAKIGAFVANIHGYFDELTPDIWMYREWRGALGTLEIRKGQKDKDGKDTEDTGLPLNETERRAMRIGVDKLAKKLEDTWRSATPEGKTMRTILGKPQKITRANIQATLWYMTQQTWARQGSGSVRSRSFHDAAMEIGAKHKDRIAEREEGRKAVQAAWLSGLYHGSSPERQALEEGQRQFAADPNKGFRPPPKGEPQRQPQKDNKGLDFGTNMVKTTKDVLDKQLAEQKKGKQQEQPSGESGFNMVFPPKKDQYDQKYKVSPASWYAPSPSLEENLATVQFMIDSVAEMVERPSITVKPVGDGKYAVMLSDGSATHSVYDTKEEAQEEAELLRSERTEFNQGPVRLEALKLQRQFVIEAIHKATGKPVTEIEAQMRRDAAAHAKMAPIRQALFMAQRNQGVQAARENFNIYAAKNKIRVKPEFDYVVVPEQIGMQVADAFDALVHSPNDPDVLAAYDAFAADTKKQWDHLVEQGVEMEPWTREGQPYANSAEMMEDVKKGHLYFFLGGDMPADHPSARYSGVTINGVKLSNNDIFRAVHDYFGHAVEGLQFGPRGEYNATRAHAQLYSAEAMPAMLSETLGQNSWVNFGPHLRRIPQRGGGLPNKGEEGYVPVTERPYAEQKAALLPNTALPAEFKVGYSTEQQINTPKFKRWFGDSKVVDYNGKPLIVYHITKGNFDVFDPSRAIDVGVHFGSYEQANNRGAAGLSWEGRTLRGEGHSIIPAYLSIQNPLYVPDMFSTDMRFRDRLLNLSDSGLDIEDLIDPVDELIAEYRRLGTGALQRIEKDFWKLIQPAMEAQGFDGFVYENENEGEGLSYAVLKPEQIKSALGNTGAFDRNDPRTLFQPEQLQGNQVLGSTEFDPKTKEPGFMNLFRGADIHTITHEFAHGARRFLSDPDMAIAEDWVTKVTNTPIVDGVWSREHEEAFARGFEQYLLEGKLLDGMEPEMERVFEAMKQIFIDIYKGHTAYQEKGQVDDLAGPLDENIKGVYARLLGIDTSPMTPEQDLMVDAARAEAGLTLEPVAVFTTDLQEDARDMMLTYCRWDFRRMPIVDQRGLLEDLWEVQQNKIQPMSNDEVLGPVFEGRVSEFRESGLPKQGLAALQRRFAKRLTAAALLDPSDPNNAREIVETDRFGGHAFSAMYPNRQVAKRRPDYILYTAAYHPDFLLALFRARATLAGVNIKSSDWRAKEADLVRLVGEAPTRPTFINVTYNQSQAMQANSDGPLQYPLHLTHYSTTAGLSLLDPSYQGTGARSSRTERDSLIKRVYFYITGKGKPEPVVVKDPKIRYRYNAILSPDQPLYDLSTDPEGIIAEATKANDGIYNPDKALAAIRDAGFAGYHASKAGSGSNIVALFNPQLVEEADYETGNPKGTQALFMATNNRPRFIVSHAVSRHNFVRAISLGYMPAASIALKDFYKNRKEGGGVLGSTFGDIVFILKPEFVDPKDGDMHLFNRDAYTPRFKPLEDFAAYGRNPDDYLVNGEGVLNKDGIDIGSLMPGNDWDSTQPDWGNMTKGEQAFFEYGPYLLEPGPNDKEYGKLGDEFWDIGAGELLKGGSALPAMVLWTMKPEKALNLAADYARDEHRVSRAFNGLTMQAENSEGSTLGSNPDGYSVVENPTWGSGVLLYPTDLISDNGLSVGWDGLSTDERESIVLLDGDSLASRAETVDAWNTLVGRRDRGKLIRKITVEGSLEGEAVAILKGRFVYQARLIMRNATDPTVTKYGAEKFAEMIPQIESQKEVGEGAIPTYLAYGPHSLYAPDTFKEAFNGVGFDKTTKLPAKVNKFTKPEDVVTVDVDGTMTAHVYGMDQPAYTVGDMLMNHVSAGYPILGQKGVELDPVYREVIVEGWNKLKDEDGRTFGDFLAERDDATVDMTQYISNGFMLPYIAGWAIAPEVVKLEIETLDREHRRLTELEQGIVNKELLLIKSPVYTVTRGNIDVDMVVDKRAYDDFVAVSTKLKEHFHKVSQSFFDQGDPMERFAIESNLRDEIDKARTALKASIEAAYAPDIYDKTRMKPVSVSGPIVSGNVNFGTDTLSVRSDVGVWNTFNALRDNAVRTTAERLPEWIRIDGTLTKKALKSGIDKMAQAFASIEEADGVENKLASFIAKTQFGPAFAGEKFNIRTGKLLTKEDFPPEEKDVEALGRKHSKHILGEEDIRYKESWDGKNNDHSFRAEAFSVRSFKSKEDFHQTAKETRQGKRTNNRDANIDRLSREAANKLNEFLGEIDFDAVPKPDRLKFKAAIHRYVDGTLDREAVLKAFDDLKPLAMKGKVSGGVAYNMTWEAFADAPNFLMKAVDDIRDAVINKVGISKDYVEAKGAKAILPEHILTIMAPEDDVDYVQRKLAASPFGKAGITVTPYSDMDKVSDQAGKKKAAEILKISPQTLFMTAHRQADPAPKPTPRYAATHGLDIANLKKAIKAGYIPAPSVAVTDSFLSAQNAADSNFGDVVLILKPEFVDPSQPDMNLFSRDAFTPRYKSMPKALKEVEGETLEEKAKRHSEFIMTGEDARFQEGGWKKATGFTSETFAVRSIPTIEELHKLGELTRSGAKVSYRDPDSKDEAKELAQVAQNLADRLNLFLQETKKRGAKPEQRAELTRAIYAYMDGKIDKAEIKAAIDTAAAAGKAQSPREARMAASLPSLLEYSKEVIDKRVGISSDYLEAKGPKAVFPADILGILTHKGKAKEVRAALAKSPDFAGIRVFEHEAKEGATTEYAAAFTTARREIEDSGQRTLFMAQPHQNAQSIAAAAQRIAAAFTPSDQAGIGTIIGDVRKSMMLSSPKTHLRNIVGNLAYQSLEELSRYPAMMLDVIMATRYGQRSITANPVDLMKAVGFTFSTKDGVTTADQGGLRRFWLELRGVNTGLDNGQATQGKDHGWNSDNPIIDKLEKLTQVSFRFLAAEDAMFNTFALRRHLLDAARVAVKNGNAASQAQFMANLDDETIQRAYADALMATFNSSNKASSWISGFKASLAQEDTFTASTVKLAIDLLVPFDRTPTNLILRTLDYTPIGFVTGSGGRKEASYRVNQRGNAGEAIASSLVGKIRQAEMIRRVDKTLQNALTKRDLELLQREMAKQTGRALVGTIVMIGAILGAKGILRGIFGGLDDDDDEQGRITAFGGPDDKVRNDTAGQIRNAIRIGNRWYSIDGMPPIGNLLLLGASLNEAAYRGETSSEAGVSLLAEVGRQALQLPVVRGFTDLGRAMEDENRTPSFVGRLASSFIPAVVRDIADYMDTEERDTQAKGWEGVANNIKVGIPGKLGGFGRESLPVARDFLGRKATPKSGLAAFVDIFRSVESRSSGLDPDSVGKGADADKVFKELSRHDITLTKPTKEDGESEEDYNKRVTVVGTAVYRALQAEVQSDRYKEMAGLRDKAGNPMQAEQLKVIIEKAKGRATKHLNRILKERGKVEPEKPIEYPHQIAEAKAKAEAEKRKAAKAAAKAAQFPTMPTLSSLTKPKKPKPEKPKTLEALDEPAQPRRANHPWNFEEDEGGGWQ